ncbi:helix-turn-helix domain-containing protein [Lysinibacillus endophyticus]|uniref:helix-turn-helix domain-containing protein n=1 Tax=Ureibacillus endophyticus TaxID=1978490 RepID=UPI00209EDC24|nr:helix-turn-helix domain-containing protein [Lysinibacillus endophyticus]MCP1145783.1 helix-turn-helix domain-containing protein [Lysinibacillus endophyticus]
MAIIRVEKNENYVVLDRGLLNDARLSWKAKGILAYMLSMPDDWVFYVEELMKHGADGEKSFRSGFNELKKFGYLERFPVYENHQIVKWETIVYEVPQNLLAQNVQEGNSNPPSINQKKEALLNTDFKLNTELLNTDIKDIV